MFPSILRNSAYKIISQNFFLGLTKQNQCFSGVGVGVAVPHRNISISSVLFAEPMKKKKKIDPAIVRAREEKRKRRLEKQIRRLEKHQRQLKPIDELEVPIVIVDEPRVRTRKLPQLPTEVLNARWKLSKEWSLYRKEQVAAEDRFFNQMKESQAVALDELQKENLWLYEEAIKIHVDLLPFEAKGPNYTPPNPNYVPPDGDYVDISKKWD